MGVPKFFAWLMKNYKKNNFIFKKDDLEVDTVNNIDWFLIDTNCLIHPMCFKILAEQQELHPDNNINFKSLENKMINGVLNYIEKLVKYVEPKKGIYIAIDGPVGASKIKQQRQRRFRSYNDKEHFDRIKKKYNKPIGYFWSNSSISPGTKFMQKIHLKVLDWCERNKKPNIKIIYSSANTPGEGEHKLLDFIKENNKKKKKYSYVTYGLDADLIFLMSVTKLDNVYLLREAQHFDNSKSEELNYVSIKIMKDCILDTFQKDNSEINLNRDRIVNDFIFLCYFLGNDFLPHLYALDIGKSGIEYLVNKYRESFLEVNDYILSEDTKIINQTVLNIFIDKIAENEEAIIIKNYKKKKYFRFTKSDPYEKEMEKIDNLFFKINDPIGLGVDSNYRFNFYNHHYGVTENDIEEFVENMVKEYLRGIRWTTYYYFQEIPDWKWFYPYDYPPFLSDIKKYMINMNEITFTKNKPISPLEQLLVILPPQMNFLLPYKLSKIVINPKSSLAHLFPLNFHIDFLYKNKYYEGIPILPHLEIDNTCYTFSKYKKELTKEELERNRLDKLFIF